MGSAAFRVPSTPRMQFPRLTSALLGVLGALIGARGESVSAQGTAWQDERFEFRRAVSIAETGAAPAVVVVDFFTHGSLNEGGDNLAV